MPVYRYACRSCHDCHEVAESIRAEARTLCSVCGEPTLHRILFPPAILDLTPRTLGGQADKNTREMGRYKLDSLEKKSHDWRTGYRGSDPDDDGSWRDMSAHERPDFLPANQAGPNLALANLTPEQQTNYVLTGSAD